MAMAKGLRSTPWTEFESGGYLLMEAAAEGFVGPAAD